MLDLLFSIVNELPEEGTPIYKGKFQLAIERLTKSCFYRIYSLLLDYSALYKSTNAKNDINGKYGHSIVILCSFAWVQEASI